jgi:hypothetical protein
MQTSTLDTNEAQNKRWAAQDARMRNIANKSKYSQAIQVRVERMKMVLTLVYSAKNIYDAYGKKGISIKVDGAFVKDRKALSQLEADWTAQGVAKKVSAQGVIYRFQ